MFPNRNFLLPFYKQCNIINSKGVIKLESIGQRITKARERLDMNQKELCQKTGIKESTLSRYENDIREPKASTLLTIAETLNVSFDYLMGVSDDFESFHHEDDTDEELELEKILENTEKKLSREGLSFYGKPVTKEDIDKLLTAIKVGISVMDSNKK